MTSRTEGTSDIELWELSGAGDADAFGQLFERHAKLIYNYCFRAIGDLEVAGDLLSITFLEVWRRRNTELSEGKVLPWLYGIATNVIRNRRRSERRFAAALSRVSLPEPEPDFSELADDRLDDERRMKRALSLLAQLPTQEREAFLLYTCMELSYDDAALALSVPVGTVRSRLARARMRLRELESRSGHKEMTESEEGGLNDEGRETDSAPTGHPERPYGRTKAALAGRN